MRDFGAQPFLFLCDPFMAADKDIVQPPRPEAAFEPSPLWWSVQVWNDREARLGFRSNLRDRDVGGKLDQGHAGASVLVDGQNGKVSNHHIDDSGSGQRQSAS